MTDANMKPYQKLAALGLVLGAALTPAYAAEQTTGDASAGLVATQPTGGAFDAKAKTAVLFVNGFNGLGLHTLFNIIRLFGGTFKNFVFVQIWVIDAGNFKGAEEVVHLEAHSKEQVDRYVAYMRQHGYFAEGHSAVGIDVESFLEKRGERAHAMRPYISKRTLFYHRRTTS